ncbi:Fe3+-hydroxamate ABC transporter substrate-binding protein [Halorubrum californiense DSM 19288]|uniref:Fe3+-hydroxamate ABC transporter substrate-binding protein n=1 Tax=Halorubrum californiense DSM 19288 TaxID=1227465 RepID=M0DYN9_9EURY|nr:MULTISPECIES: ABC transporter substrate-binding protein [Halorubrum]ELZ40596.1 Fe3+-hydroxamate ABC transporter substrate-binding protein [Halorubrum californiense DSM 19288]TKX66512.1 cobalamin-binding protein [Halorubrum sp. GN11GM_10-3_MGM]
MRVASLLPSATETLFALGVEPVGVSHSCDHPPAARELPTLTSTVVDHADRSAADIDEQMREVDGAVYDLDEERLAALEPDLLVTQATCDVCAVDASEVRAAAERLDPAPDVLACDPHSFADALDDVVRIGEAVGETDAATALRADLRERVDAVRERAERAVTAEGRPRTAVLDWTDPPIRAGHWVRDMVEIAGGDPSFQPDGPSEPVAWADVREFDPEALVVAPCGFDRDRAVDAVGDLAARSGFDDLAAVADDRVYAVDGNGLFNRPSHRLVDSLEALFACLHPEYAATEPGELDAVARVDAAATASVRADGG